MEKDAVVQALCQKGYQAYNDKGVVMIHVLSLSSEKTIRKLLNELNYHCSFGITGPIANNLKTSETVEDKTQKILSPTDEPNILLYTDEAEQFTFQW